MSKHAGAIALELAACQIGQRELASTYESPALMLADASFSLRLCTSDWTERDDEHVQFVNFDRWLHSLL